MNAFSIAPQSAFSIAAKFGVPTPVAGSQPVDAAKPPLRDLDAYFRSVRLER